MNNNQLRPPPTSWPRAPLHKLAEAGTYFVTCSTYNKIHYFSGKDRVAVLHRGLMSVAEEFEWQLEAWAVFSNHYHFVAHSPPGEDNAKSLPLMLGKLHAKTARWINKQDHQRGRQVWHNYRETQLTYHTSYLSRLNYVHHNPVKHRLVGNPAAYPWCSAGWFERTASPAQVKSLYAVKFDHIKVEDDYEPSMEW